MISPLDEFYPEKDPRDFCACLCRRDAHVVEADREVCVVCRDRGIKALAFPWHEFHLAWPERPLATLPRDVAMYEPPHGWDRPSPARQ